MTKIKVNDLNEVAMVGEQEAADVKGGEQRPVCYLTYKLHR